MTAKVARPLPECVGPCGRPMGRQKHRENGGLCDSCREELETAQQLSLPTDGDAW